MIRSLLSSAARVVIAQLEPHLPRPRVIHDRSGRLPYLSRYYLTARPTMADGSAPFDASGQTKPGIMWPSEPFAIYLHRFHRDDDGTELHNHPWRWSLSFVLAGGYLEERRIGRFVIKRVVRPLSFNFIGHDDFHRVDLIEDDAWTLFFTGPKVSSWGFWDRAIGEFIPWREYITRLRGPGWQES